MALEPTGPRPALLQSGGRQLRYNTSVVLIAPASLSLSSVEDGTLTRSLKLRRHVIFEKYARVIEEVERQLH